MILRCLVLFIALAPPVLAQKLAAPRLQSPLGGNHARLAPITQPIASHGTPTIGGISCFTSTLKPALVSPFSAVSIPQPAALSERTDPALATPAPDETAATAPASSDKTTRQYELLPRALSEHFAAPKDHPATHRYLEMMAKLSDSWSSPFDGATLNKAQQEAAEAANVTLKRPEKDGDVLYIPGGDGSWINRWARGLKRNMGVTLLWSPISNHNRGHIAAYESSDGWLWADNYGPLLTKPTSALLHEFLHAYVDCGKYAHQFTPLRTSFTRGWGSFPKANVYQDAGYTHYRSFRSDEILTNFHTLYHMAKGIAEEYGKTPDDWTASAYDNAPQEVQGLIKLIETPLFLSESVEEMSADLISGVLDLAEAGLRRKKFKKSYDRPDGSIPYVGEVEQNAKKDHGFYEAVIRYSKNKRLTVQFFTRGQFAKNEAARANVFPVIIGNGKYSVRVELALDRLLKHNLDDPVFQEQIAVFAARLMAPWLAQLIDVNERLAFLRERLKALQVAGRQHVDLALVREIRDTAKTAFFIVARYFIHQPARA